MVMLLNTIKPNAGATHKVRRVGRGIGSGLGKTCGRGHKGQKSRAGGFHKVGFEGGQMPLQRRLPKRGFKSPVAKFHAEIDLNVLERYEDGMLIDLAALKKFHDVPARTKVVKVLDTGKLTKAVRFVAGDEFKFSKNARASIEAAGGKIDEN